MYFQYMFLKYVYGKTIAQDKWIMNGSRYKWPLYFKGDLNILKKSIT